MNLRIREGQVGRGGGKGHRRCWKEEREICCDYISIILSVFLSVYVCFSLSVCVCVFQYVYVSLYFCVY